MQDFCIARILPGDCLDVMSEMDDESIDLIFTSPPYSDQRASTYGGVDADKYVDWFSPRAAEMKRILKPTGSFVLNIKEKSERGERHTYVLDLILHLKRELGWRWVEEYIWHKKNPMPGIWKDRFKDGWERLLHFTKNSDFKMNQDAVLVLAGESMKSKYTYNPRLSSTRRESATGSGVGIKKSNLFGRDRVLPSNVLHGGLVSANKGHSAVFPEWLPNWFIRLFTDAGDVVLDPFAGSGTTATSAAGLGRHGIGIEILNKEEKIVTGQAAMRL